MSRLNHKKDILIKLNYRQRYSLNIPRTTVHDIHALSKRASECFFRVSYVLTLQSQLLFLSSVYSKTIHRIRVPFY